MTSIDTLVLGAGQAGLCTSYYLTQSGRDHLVLEKDRICKAWKDERWDSFTLVTPNWQLQLPGMEYEGDDPAGFLSRQAVVDYVDRFVESFDPPVLEGVEALRLERDEHSDRFIVETSGGDYSAGNVVVATGSSQMPSTPEFSPLVREQVYQLHSRDYRNPHQLPAGSVLVVGSGQSGCQIAEELHESGREVYLATSKAPRLPRRYRGRDSIRWLEMNGFIDRTADELDSPQERFSPNPHVSGKDGGRTLNLHRFSRDGIHLLGRMKGANGDMLKFAPNLHDNLAAADKFARQFKQGIDNFIQEQGLQAPPEDGPELNDGYQARIITELDINKVGISSIVWATGFGFDFSWIQIPIFDEYGYPVQERGVTPQDGLYFVGLRWLHTIKSALFLGVGDDAAHVVGQIEARG